MIDEKLTKQLTLKDLLERFGEKLEATQVRPDGSFDIEIVFQGDKETRMTISAQNKEEFLDLVRMNTDKLV